MSSNNQLNLFARANHSNMGKGWEAELESLHDFYRMNRWCDVVKNAERWIFIGETEYQRLYLIDRALVARDGNNRPMKRTGSDVDFSGGNGRFSACFDAKNTTADRFPLSMLKEHQIARLRLSDRCGCLSGFMIRMEKYNRVFFMSYKVADAKQLEKLKQSGRRAKPGTASFSIEELERNCTEIPRSPKGQYDWLKTLNLPF